MKRQRATSHRDHRFTGLPGKQWVVRVPEAAIRARMEMDAEELEQIIQSQLAFLDIVERRVDEFTERGRRNLAQQQEEEMTNWLEKRRALKQIKTMTTGGDLIQRVQEFQKNRNDPRILPEAVKAAGEGYSLDGEFTELFECAARLAIRLGDSDFFRRFGAALARAEKARKAAAKKPVNAVQAPETSSDSDNPFSDFVSWLQYFMAHRWVDEADPSAPQLCLFTDEAVIQLLEEIIPKRTFTLNDVRNTRRRYQLLRARKPVIRSVKLIKGRAGELDVIELRCGR